MVIKGADDDDDSNSLSQHANVRRALVPHRSLVGALPLDHTGGLPSQTPVLLTPNENLSNPAPMPPTYFRQRPQSACPQILYGSFAPGPHWRTSVPDSGTFDPQRRSIKSSTDAAPEVAGLYVAGAGGGRRGRRLDGGRRPGTTPDPVVTQRLGGGDAVVRVELEAALQQVDQLRVVGRLDRPAGGQCRHEVAGARRATVPTALGVAAVSDADAAVIGAVRAVARQTSARDEVAQALARRQELLVRHAEHLDDARQLVALVLAREQRVADQQLDHDAA